MGVGDLHPDYADQGYILHEVAQGHWRNSKDSLAYRPSHQGNVSEGNASFCWPAGG